MDDVIRRTKNDPRIPPLTWQRYCCCSCCHPHSAVLGVVLVVHRLIEVHGATREFVVDDSVGWHETMHDWTVPMFANE